MANAVSLVRDAVQLAALDSCGRARTLAVVAMEELAKARRLYQAAEVAWSMPLGLYGSPPEEAAIVWVPEPLRGDQEARAWVQEAEHYAAGLDDFWGRAHWGEEGDPVESASFEALASQRIAEKRGGLYVQRTGDAVSSPLEVEIEDVLGDLERVCKVLQMHLIEDHTRQQGASDPTRIDSAEDLHWALMKLMGAWPPP